MILIILAASASGAAAQPAVNVTDCANAVRSNLAAAVTACDTTSVKIDIFAKREISDACIAAMKSGWDAGKYGPTLPPAARSGLIREFERKLALCETPAKQNDVPARDTVKLWD